MTSQKQIEANRRNSLRSTGPRTASGKSRSRLNAVTHGLTAKTLILPGEDESEYHDRLTAWRRDLDPYNPYEEELVAEAVGLAWRLDRARRVQDALLAERMLEESDRLILFDDSPEAEWLRRVEAGAERGVVRIVERFRIARRRGQALSPPQPATEIRPDPAPAPAERRVEPPAPTVRRAPARSGPDLRWLGVLALTCLLAAATRPGEPVRQTASEGSMRVSTPELRREQPPAGEVTPPAGPRNPQNEPIFLPSGGQIRQNEPIFGPADLPGRIRNTQIVRSTDRSRDPPG